MKVKFRILLLLISSTRILVGCANTDWCNQAQQQLQQGLLQFELLRLQQQLDYHEFCQQQQQQLRSLEQQLQQLNLQLENLEIAGDTTAPIKN